MHSSPTCCATGGRRPRGLRLLGRLVSYDQRAKRIFGSPGELPCGRSRFPICLPNANCFPNRSDLNIMCSPVEVKLLTDRYGMSATKLSLSSFLCAPPGVKGSAGFHQRQHFMTIGGLLLL